MKVTVACHQATPERTRVENNTNRAIRVKKVGSIHQPRSNEPFRKSAKIRRGKAVTFESGYQADDRVLTKQYIYDNDVGRREGARVATSVGRFVDRCSWAGLPPRGVGGRRPTVVPASVPRPGGLSGQPSSSSSRWPLRAALSGAAGQADAAGADAAGAASAGEKLAELAVRPAGTPDPGSCDARDAALIRDGRDEVVRDGCYVASDRWFDPYTGNVYHAPGDIDVDHFVPLANAWMSGAASWGPDKKERFANAPLGLLSVEDNANASKGDKGPKAWKPPRKAYHCRYAKKWIDVKHRREPSVTRAEKRALKGMLGTC